MADEVITQTTLLSDEVPVSTPADPLVDTATETDIQDEPVTETEQPESEPADTEASSDADKPRKQRRTAAQVEAEYQAKLQAQQQVNAAIFERFQGLMQGQIDTLPQEAPDPKNYQLGEYDPGYGADLALYKMRVQQAQHAANTRQQMQQAAQQAYQAEVAAKWNVRRAQGIERYGQSFIAADNLPATPAMAEVISHDENGSDIAMFLVKNPNEHQRIIGLPPIQQVMELTRIGQRAADTKQKRSVSSAAEPITPVGRREVAAKSPETMSYDEFRVWREKSKKRA